VRTDPIAVERFDANPIIHPGLDGDLGENINGPSLLRVPDWVDDPLGDYYLYVASHAGRSIRLAYADDLAGPWRIHPHGVLHVDDTPFPSATLAGRLGQGSRLAPLTRPARRIGGALLNRLPAGRSVVPRMQTGRPHVASPDVHADPERRRLVMFYHGYGGTYVEAGESTTQFTRAATSRDGLRFESREPALGRFYFRAFGHDGRFYAVARAPSPGDQRRSGLAVYAADRRLDGYERRTTILQDGARHAAVRVRGDELQLCYSRIGDCPERILYATVDLTDPVEDWVASDPVPVLEPVEDYEGVGRPLAPSLPGAAREPVRQLRDPDLFEDGDALYLAYAVAGERGIALAEITDERVV